MPREGNGSTATPDYVALPGAEPIQISQIWPNLPPLGGEVCGISEEDLLYRFTVVLNQPSMIVR